MVVFSVYEPPNATGDRVDRAQRLTFIRDGFRWWAAIVPALWFIVKGLWLELVVFIAGAVALAWLLEAVGLSTDAISVIFLIVQIVIGFEASAINAAALERRGWHMVGTVTGRDEPDCERRFFETWLRSQPEHVEATIGPVPRNAIMSWAQTAMRRAKDTLARGRA